MNLRQKNKKLKRELEWYKKQMVPTREVSRPEIKTLVNVSYYDIHDYNGRSLENIYREVGATLTHLINEKYITFDEELVEVGSYPMMKVAAKIRVVPDGGDGF